MRRAILSLCAAVVVALASTASALAAPPEKSTAPILFLFPDTDLGLVVLINIDRETICSPEQVAWEEAFIAWLEGGEVGDPPEPPIDPEGFDSVSFQDIETGQGAVVSKFKGSGLYVEIWELDADAALVGPCTDTDDALHLIGSGTARFIGNDNDLFGSGTRGNAFGDRGIATLVDEDGNRLRYSWKFHVNSRCHAGPEGFPACLLEGSSFR
jgi:hypothetical protein